MVCHNFSPQLMLDHNPPDQPLSLANRREPHGGCPLSDKRKEPSQGLLESEERWIHARSLRSATCSTLRVQASQAHTKPVVKDIRANAMKSVLPVKVCNARGATMA